MLHGMMTISPAAQATKRRGGEEGWGLRSREARGREGKGWGWLHGWDRQLRQSSSSSASGGAALECVGLLRRTSTLEQQRREGRRRRVGGCDGIIATVDVGGEIRSRA